MILRQLPDQWIENPPAFLANLVADPELFPEIRNNSITVYYRGKAVIRDLCIRGSQICGSIHYKYIPITQPDGNYVGVVFGERGFEFVPPIAPITLGFLDPNVLAEIKRTVRSTNPGKEGGVIQGAVMRPENQIVDQEIKFQNVGYRVADKIDICIFDQHVNGFSLVEVKGIHDNRLIATDGPVPEVINQLQRYRARIEANAACLVEAFVRIVELKRSLGLGNRLVEVPEIVPRKIVDRPLLVIGGCSRIDVDEILAVNGRWKPLMDELPKVASGLILCGTTGARLQLAPGPQRLIFESLLLG